MNLKFNKIFFGALATLILFFVLFFLFSGLLRVNAQGAKTKQVLSNIPNAGITALTNIRERQIAPADGLVDGIGDIELRPDLLDVAKEVDPSLGELQLNNLHKDVLLLDLNDSLLGPDVLLS